MAQLLPDCRLNYFWIGGSPNTGLPAQRMAEYSNEGLKTNNSDLVIKGNVTIQRVLGREPQFTTQKEFDDLMESDIPLVL